MFFRENRKLSKVFPSCVVGRIGKKNRKAEIQNNFLHLNKCHSASSMGKHHNYRENKANKDDNYNLFPFDGPD